MPRPRARLDPAALTRAFAPDGLHGATSASIARSAGLAKPTVYAHGGSKEAVFLACVEAEVERLLSQLAEADLRTRSLPARVRIAALAEAVITHGRQNPAAARLLHQTARHASSEVAGEVDAALARLPARMSTILRREVRPDLADRVAPAVFAAAAAMALVESASGRPHDDAILIGDAFATVLIPAGGDDRVKTVGLY